MFRSTLAWLNLRWFWEFSAPAFTQESWQRQIFPQHRWLLKTIKILKPRSILEVGCGFGRNLNYLIKQGIKPSLLTGSDFSSRLLQRAKLPASVKLILANVIHLPFAKHKFDLVFTHGLLMHLPPREINQALEELIRVTKKYLIVIEEVRQRPGKLNYFTWAHDYEKILASYPLTVIESHLDYQLSLKWLLIKK